MLCLKWQLLIKREKLKHLVFVHVVHCAPTGTRWEVDEKFYYRSHKCLSGSSQIFMILPVKVPVSILHVDVDMYRSSLVPLLVQLSPGGCNKARHLYTYADW